MNTYHRRNGHLPVSRLRAAHLMGIHNEKRTLTILKRIQSELDWLTGIRMASPEEDQRGIDIVCETADGIYLYIQVKSSATGVRKYMETYTKGSYGIIPIVVIKVHLWKMDETIKQELTERLVCLRQQLLTVGVEYWRRSQIDVSELRKSLIKEAHRMDSLGAQKLLEAIQAYNQEHWLKDVKITNFSEPETNGIIQFTGQEATVWLVCLKDTPAIQEIGGILSDNIHRAHVLTIVLPKEKEIGEKFVHRLFTYRLTPVYKRVPPMLDTPF